MGSAILSRHYKLDTRVVVGEAAYCLPKVGVVAFSQPNNAVRRAGEIGAFHCWVEANGWLLDFSSIAFPLIAKAAGFGTCPFLMFQKPTHKAAAAIPEFNAESEFYISSHGINQSEVTAPLTAKQAFIDLVQIAADWYRKPPKPMGGVGLRDQHGNTKPAFLSSQRILGVW